jgi:hypothetical protein
MWFLTNAAYIIGDVSYVAQNKVRGSDVEDLLALAMERVEACYLSRNLLLDQERKAADTWDTEKEALSRYIQRHKLLITGPTSAFVLLSILSKLITILQIP